ncbi:MAG: hypothetical protein KDE19_00630, partial [Caldilineaceae bacterium]|nr:hypothetical protein [Caldilineaceae bacterium]
MRNRIISILLFATLLIAFQAPHMALAQESTQSAAPINLNLYTAFPSEVIGLDESISLPLKLHTDTTPQIVQLSTADVPEGWTVTLRGANRIINSAFVQPGSESSIDLKVEPPQSVASGEYDFTVIAKGNDTTAELPIALTVKDRIPPRMALSIDLPTKRGKPDTTFTYDVTLANEGDEDLQVNLAADAPNTMVLTYKLNGQEIEDLPLEANST